MFATGDLMMQCQDEIELQIMTAYSLTQRLKNSPKLIAEIFVAFFNLKVWSINNPQRYQI